MDIGNYVFYYEGAYCLKDSVVHIGLAVLFAVLWIKTLIAKKK
jgi:hypothetical protein